MRQKIRRARSGSKRARGPEAGVSGRAGPTPAAGRSQGSAVTWVVVLLMIVSLAIYLGVAFFSADPGTTPPAAGSPPATTTDGR